MDMAAADKDKHMERFQRDKSALLTAIEETTKVLLKDEIEKLHQNIKKLQRGKDKLHDQTENETNTVREEVKKVLEEIAKDGDDDDLRELLIQKGELLGQRVKLLEQMGTMSEYGTVLSTWTDQLLYELEQIVAPSAASSSSQEPSEESGEDMEGVSPQGSCSPMW